MPFTPSPAAPPAVDSLGEVDAGHVESLLDQRVGRPSRLAAGAVVGMVLLVSLLVAPRGGLPLPAVAAFMPMYLVSVVITEGLTAYLLATLFSATRVPLLGCLAAAYAFVTVMAGLQLLVFPGLLAPMGLFGAGPQSAIWVWLLWHGGFPALVLLGVASASPRLGGGVGANPAHGGGWWRVSQGLLLATPLLALGLGYLVTTPGSQGHVLITGDSYATLSRSLLAKIVFVLNVLALGGCLAVTRLRNLLGLWLAVALVASVADTGLTLAATERYSLGWYVARCLSLTSSAVVLGALIREIAFLYRRVASANRRLAERAMRDGLTGAYNRGFLDEQGPRVFAGARRDRRPLSVLMIDVDHFKHYNDSQGHQQGDRCLVAVVSAIQGVLQRPADFLARYGGEEFLVVLPGTGTAGAVHAAEAIRAAVAARRLARTDGLSAFVTVSLGVTTGLPPGDDLDFDELVRRADAALYQAKGAGRDRAWVYGQTAPVGQAAAGAMLQGGRPPRA